MRSFLQLLIACVLIVHAHASDGWEKVKWGMTMEQVKEIYPKAIRPDLPPDLESMDSLIPPSSSMEMAGYEWQGLAFSVTFVFDKAKGLAACFLMSTHDRKSPTLELTPQHERVVKALSTTYGKPEEGTWIGGGTEVRCSLIFADDPGRTAIVVGYFESERGQKKK